MYVILDLEWQEVLGNTYCPTQLSAIRVTNDWYIDKEFYSRIHPENGGYYLKSHVAFNGGTHTDFQNAPFFTEVLSRFETWLLPSDVLCWWNDTPSLIFHQLCRTTIHRVFPHRNLHLLPCFQSLVHDSRKKNGSAYTLAHARNIATPDKAHYSPNDVRAICALLQGTHISQAVLDEEPSMDITWYPPEAPRLKTPPKPKKPTSFVPYAYDPVTNLVHQTGCPEAPPPKQLVPHGTLLSCIKKQYRPCPACCKDEWRKAVRQRNTDIIHKSKASYFYFKESSVFHRETCHFIQNSLRPFYCTSFYKSCISAGRTPCRICKPTPPSPLPLPPSLPIPVRAPKPPSRPLFETQALKRHAQARKERLAAKGKVMTPKERKDLLTLTQPGNAFWAVPGYSNFHLRSCPKLNGMTGLQGFSTYDEACRAGFRPCRHCKPSTKHDLLVSIPFDNLSRNDENISDILTTCHKKRSGLRLSRTHPAHSFLRSAVACKCTPKSVLYRTHAPRQRPVPLAAPHFSLLDRCGALHCPPRCARRIDCLEDRKTRLRPK